MKKKRVVRVDFLFLLWISVIAVISFFSVQQVRRLVGVLPKENFKQKVTGSITRQGDWFIKNQTPAGDFVYERYAATGEIKEGNSIVRQAGALYGLGQLYAYTKNPKTKMTLEKGFDYFRGLTATPSASANVITHNGQTLTNTTALLVLGLVEYLEADNRNKTTENLEYLVRLSNYLASTQTSTGAYINEYVPKPAESDYNNGETMYALIRSYNVTQKQEYLLSVKRMASYAMEYYGPQGFNSSFFSWGMAGFSYLYAEEPDEKYWEFLRQYADKYMTSRGAVYEQFLNHTSETAITPGASVFLEGVNHIAWVAKDKDPGLYRTLKRHVERVLDFLLTYELDGPYGKYASGKDMVRGAICSQKECETTRIDFLQHNISAILLYVKFLM